MTQAQTEHFYLLDATFTVCYIHKGAFAVPMGQTTAALQRFLQAVDENYGSAQSTLIAKRARHELANHDWPQAMQALYRLAMRAHAATGGVYAPYQGGLRPPVHLVRAWAIQEAFAQYLQPLLTSGQLVAAALQGGDDLRAGVAEDSDWHWGFGYTTPAHPERYAYHFELQNAALATMRRGFDQLSVQAPDIITAAVWADAGLQQGSAWLEEIAQRQGLQAVAVTGRAQPVTIGAPQVAIA